MSLVGQALRNLGNNLSGNFGAVQPLGKPVQAAPVAPISQGVTSKPVPTVAPVKKTTLLTSQKSTYSPSFSASTLAQQKSLNAQGAGLKEDGIMGPKTQAAISKYTIPAGSTTPTQNTAPEAPVAPVSTPTREVDTTYQGLLKQAIEQATRAADFQNTLDQKSNDLTKQGIAMESVQGQQATLQRGYGAQAQAEASKANALANLASINRPTQSSPTDVPFDPSTGKYGTPAASAYGTGGLAGLGATLAQQQIGGDFANKYAQGNAKMTAANGIESQIANTLNSNPEINSTNSLSFITDINRYLSGQIGTPAQQKLAQQVNSYISTLGIDPSTVVSVATQNRGSIKDLLSSLKKTYQVSNIDPYNPSNLYNGSTQNSNQTTTAGGYTYKLVNGKWVVSK